MVLTAVPVVSFAKENFIITYLRVYGVMHLYSKFIQVVTNYLLYIINLKIKF